MTQNDVTNSTDIENQSDIDDSFYPNEIDYPKGYDTENPGTYHGIYMRYWYSEKYGEFCFFFVTGDIYAKEMSCKTTYKYLLQSSKYQFEVVDKCGENGTAILKFSPVKTKIKISILQLSRQENQKHTELPITLVKNQELKIAFSEPDYSPAVGVLDVIHQTPELSGKGDLRVLYGEALEWGPRPNAPTDAWNKICTIKNCSRTSQDVIVRFFSIITP